MFQRLIIAVTLVGMAAVTAACNGEGSGAAVNDAATATMRVQQAEATLTAIARPQVSPSPVPSAVIQPTQVIVIVPTDTPHAVDPATVVVQPPEKYISVKSAVEDYYALIQQSQYSIAWEMVTEFNQSQGTTFDAFVSGWQASGPAVIAQPFDYPDSGDTATITLVLNYPLKNVTHTLRYNLVRDPSRGSSRFGYWIFVYGTLVN